MSCDRLFSASELFSLFEECSVQVAPEATWRTAKCVCTRAFRKQKNTELTKT